MGRKVGIVFLFLIKFPPYEQVISNVYAGKLAKKHNFFFIMPAEDKKFEGEREWKGVKCYITRAPRKSFSLKAIDYMVSFLQKIRYSHRIIRENEIDYIFVRNDPLDALLGLYLKKRFNIRLIFRYTYPIYESMIEEARLGISPYPRVFAHMFGRFGNGIIYYVMRRADLILAMSDYMKEDLNRRGLGNNKINVLTMGANVPKKMPDGSLIRKKHNLAFPTLIYLGNMDKIRDIGFLIEVFRLLKEDGVRFNALMVGSGNDLENLKAKCKEYGLEKEVIFTGKVAPDEVPAYIAASDIGLSPFKPIEVLKTTTPTKLMEYMALGKPYVCNEEIPDMKYVTEKSKGGLAVRYEAKAFKDAIIAIISDKDFKKMGENGKKWLMKNREYTVLSSKFEEMIYERP